MTGVGNFNPVAGYHAKNDLGEKGFCGFSNF
jgi:hypothetical protein